ERPLEPPVAEQLGVVRRAYEGLTAVAGLVDRLPDHVHEVGRLQADLLGCDLGVVDLLGAEVARMIGDLPEAQAPGEMLLVELEEVEVARVAVLTAPHLQGGARIA